MKTNNNINNKFNMLKQTLKSNRKIITVAFCVFLFIFLPLFKINNSRTNLLNILINNRKETANYRSEVKQVDITSDNYGNPGTWKINSSGEWTGLDEAKTTLNLSSVVIPKNPNKDILIIIDSSDSMEGDKLTTEKNAAKNVINRLLNETNINIAMGVLNSSSGLYQSFTKNETDLINAVDKSTALGSRDIYNCYSSILRLMSKAEIDSASVIIVTGGKPSSSNSNNKKIYNSIKKEFPNIDFNIIQYSTGSEIYSEYTSISDNQYIANSNNLEEKIYEAATANVIYDNFEVSAYLNNTYFELESIDQVKSIFGKPKLELENGKQKIVWNIDNYMTGSKDKLEIQLKLKDLYKKQTGNYPIFTNIKVEYKIPGQTLKTKSNTSTPTLEKKLYSVIYTTNAPASCLLPLSYTDSYYEFETVKLRDDLKCNGYTFKGWTVSEDAIKMNDSKFNMPNNNIIVKAEWGEPKIVKTMDGTPKTRPELYNVVENDAANDNHARKYTGEVTDTLNGSGNKDVYYYHGDADNNNVIFGNFCWQMMRTTATGGVKLIYAGTPIDGKCMDLSASIDRSPYSAYYALDQLSLVGYMINPDTNYDVFKSLYLKTTESMVVGNGIVANSDGTYTLTGTTTYTNDEWPLVKGQQIGKYVCMDVDKLKNITKCKYPYTITSLLGNIKIYDSNSESPILYSKTIAYSDGEYKLSNPKTEEEIISDGDTIAKYYTCFNSTGKCPMVSYYIRFEENNNRFITLKNGETLENAIDNMIGNENANQVDSSPKEKIDSWFENNLVTYKNYIEDTVYCNDRSYETTEDNSILSFNFGAYNRINPSLKCNNISDRFMTSNNSAKLKYPIAAPTFDEIVLSTGDPYDGYSNRHQTYIKGSDYGYLYVMTPTTAIMSHSSIYVSALSYYDVTLEKDLWYRDSMYIKPVISLKPHVKYSGGDGTTVSPYIVD